MTCLMGVDALMTERFFIVHTYICVILHTGNLCPSSKLCVHSQRPVLISGRFGEDIENRFGFRTARGLLMAYLPTALKFQTVPPTGKHTATVIFLHVSMGL